jgi:chromosome segregation ATPase
MKLYKTEQVAEWAERVLDNPADYAGTSLRADAVNLADAALGMVDRIKEMAERTKDLREQQNVLVDRSNDRGHEIEDLHVTIRTLSRRIQELEKEGVPKEAAGEPDDSAYLGDRLDQSLRELELLEEHLQNQKDATADALSGLKRAEDELDNERRARGEVEKFNARLEERCRQFNRALEEVRNRLSGPELAVAALMDAVDRIEHPDGDAPGTAMRTFTLIRRIRADLRRDPE